MRLLYYPPDGWKYDFPKSYLPLPGETMEQTLIRDGYPEEKAASAAEHTDICRDLT